MQLMVIQVERTHGIIFGVKRKTKWNDSLSCFSIKIPYPHEVLPVPGPYWRLSTKPLWKKMVEPNMTIFKMAPYINEFVRTLELLSTDA